MYIHMYICYFLFVGFVIVGVVCVPWHTALCILTFSRFLIFEKKQTRVVLRELTILIFLEFAKKVQCVTPGIQF